MRRIIRGRDLIYVSLSRKGTRVIGGSRNYLADADRFVVYRSLYPVLRVSFSPFAEGALCSSINPKHSTWQSTLPLARLGIPDELELSAASTMQPAVFDEDGALTIDLGAALQRSAEPLEEAQRLLARLGELMIAHEELSDRIEQELGVKLVYVG